MVGSIVSKVSITKSFPTGSGTMPIQATSSAALDKRSALASFVLRLKERIGQGTVRRKREFIYLLC